MQDIIIKDIIECGYVFRDRFKSEGIYSEDQLNNCIRYIYNNPVKAGICSSPEQYPYSNYKPVKNITNSKYNFIDVKEDQVNEYKEYVSEFLNKVNMNLDELKQNRGVLKQLVRTLNTTYKVSLRKIAEELNIGREKIRRISKG